MLYHNAVIGVRSDDNQEYLIMGKGIGFWKKVSERIEERTGDSVYSLQKASERGDARELGKPIDVMSLSYNRLMNHIRYMVAGALKGELPSEKF